MIAALAVTVGIYAVAVAGWLIVQAFRSEHERETATTATLIVLECGVVLLAIAHLIAVVSGHRPEELAVHLAYLGASVGLLPMTVAISSAGRQAPGMPAAVGCVAVAVVVVRLQVTAG